MARFALIACLALTFALVPAASGSDSGGLVSGAPSGLRAFLLRADEKVAHEYSRTPSFSWAPVAERGGHYQFELATSQRFADGSIVFKDNKVPFPAETIPRQLPWVTGDPHGLWAHVRWVSDNASKATKWSAPFGFDLQWANIPQQLPAPEGLIRWTPVDGATSYEVIYTDFSPVVSFQATTNVADQREYFTLHNAIGYRTIHWRVRAVRNLGKLGATNGLPAVSYGPWSPVLSTVNAPQAYAATLVASDTVSDKWDVRGKGKPAAHEFTPGFAWAPTSPVITGGVDPGSSLYRVYVFSDSKCVNRIFTGSIVGSPSFAPRSIGGPQPLPQDTLALADAGNEPYLTGAGSEGNAFDAAGKKVAPNEAGSAASSAAGAGAGASGSSSAPAAASTTGPNATTGSAAAVDLWDSGWPTGRFYWTVVPVSVVPGPPPKGAAADATRPVSYRDMAIPQDSCEAGNAGTFGKVSQPVVTSAGRPFVSGVAPSGRMIAGAGMKAEVYAQPIVAWQPTVGASRYQVDISPTLYPWHSKWYLTTPGTSMVLPLTKRDAGVWYYRVRSINDSLPKGAHAMAWSTPVRVSITGDRFTIVK